MNGLTDRWMDGRTNGETDRWIDGRMEGGRQGGKQGGKEKEQLSFLIALFVLIVVGNSLVIFVIAMSKNRRSRMNFFILNLAIADLSAGLVNVLTDIIWKSTIDWYGGDVGCKLIRYGQGVVTYASTYALVALSVDRLDVIARPLRFSGSEFRSKVLVALAWSCALVFSIPMLIINKLQVVDGSTQCWIEFPEWMWKLYITSIAVVLFVIPAFVIAVCYIIIVIIIWSKTSMQMSSTTPSKRKDRSLRNGSHVVASSNNKRFKECATSSRGVIPKAKIKTIKMTLVIVLVFIFCWSPYFVFDLLHVYGSLHSQDQDIIAISTFIQSMAPLNSAANPIIFFGFNSNTCMGIFKRSFNRYSPTSQTQLTKI
ncbi:cardioacceleratory peptide receptor-like [Gigantopelta aegis]|uniref:cardioacceleratory peptide receptor-like n=1 Tax=Gigantopelta aegis TaxID=1735272 RepID=UPI001B88CC3B|nr:cardioacceleratory peptide receptor-like [Gigantopelta aegis]